MDQLFFTIFYFNSQFFFTGDSCIGCQEKILILFINTKGDQCPPVNMNGIVRKSEFIHLLFFVKRLALQEGVHIVKGHKKNLLLLVQNERKIKGVLWRNSF